jgi:alkanesulfonate monooxygenase SsuD/methylene tetrahydromethanopterin reductase-like flavin-dependent oxidoreductase (luciferase family)
VAAGYVASEYAMFGKDMTQRNRLQVEALSILKKAWSGEPFEYLDSTIQVTPRPYQRPWPTIYMGGSSPKAAQRAARLADAFEGTSVELNQVYRNECARLGVPAHVDERPSLPAQFLYLADDVEDAWKTIEPHAFHEMNSYGAWLEEAGMASVGGGYRRLNAPGQVRASGMYLVMRPDDLVERLQALGSDAVVYLHPLMGGLPPDFSWRSLRLFEERVLPRMT